MAEDGNRPAFRRVLLKLSGEALMGDLEYGADPERIAAIAAQVKHTADRDRKSTRLNSSHESTSRMPSSA